jgi:HD superfamily phosphodiesterase
MSLEGTVLFEMIKYDEGNLHNIEHFIKVHAFAKLIGESENLDKKTQSILEIAALVHDIGIKVSLEKYGNCSGKNQEIEGPSIAMKLLEAIEVDREIIDRVCYLVGHHHTLGTIDGMDYQILIEADFIVNMGEDEKYYKARETTVQKYFKTEMSRKIYNSMFCNTIKNI